jgi:hypothetical protein
VTKDIRKILALSPAQQAVFKKLALPPAQADVFKEIAARSHWPRGQPPLPAHQGPDALKDKPQQAVIRRALRAMPNFDPSEKSTAEVERRVRKFVEDEAKRTGEKTVAPSRASIERFLGRRKD